MTPTMTQADRKAALARYHDHKPAIGIYALRCPVSGQEWIGELNATRL